MQRTLQLNLQFSWLIKVLPEVGFLLVARDHLKLKPDVLSGNLPDFLVVALTVRL
jgi:hypothetical protein